jgi:hypothetical protein
MPKGGILQFEKRIPGSAGSRRSFDQDLQSSRRLDWRFLFPDPRLRRVACLGARDGELLVALKQFSEFLEILPPGLGSARGRKGVASFDLVVLQSPAPRDLQTAFAILKPGGYLYWEFDRAELRRIRSVRAYRRLLEQYNPSQIETYWHRPNFSECLEIIPLQDQRALKFAFSRARNNLSGRLKMAAGRVLRSTGLLPSVVRCFSFTARKAVSRLVIV